MLDTVHSVFSVNSTAAASCGLFWAPVMSDMLFVLGWPYSFPPWKSYYGLLDAKNHSESNCGENYTQCVPCWTFHSVACCECIFSHVFWWRTCAAFACSLDISFRHCILVGIVVNILNLYLSIRICIWMFNEERGGLPIVSGAVMSDTVLVWSNLTNISCPWMVYEDHDEGLGKNGFVFWNSLSFVFAIEDH